jgi:hypothetical protein
MQKSTPPEWIGWHPDLAREAANGHDLQIGQTLGQLLAEGSHQSRLLERISDHMHSLPADIARLMPQPLPPSPPPDRLSWGEKLQLLAAVVMVIFGLMGKVSAQQIADWLLKQSGG